MTREQLSAIVATGAPFADSLDNGLVPVNGDTAAVRKLFATLDEFPSMFNILEP